VTLNKVIARALYTVSGWNAVRVQGWQLTLEWWLEQYCLQTRTETQQRQRVSDSSWQTVPCAWCCNRRRAVSQSWPTAWRHQERGWRAWQCRSMNMNHVHAGLWTCRSQHRNFAMGRFWLFIYFFIKQRLTRRVSIKETNRSRQLVEILCCTVRYCVLNVFSYNCFMARVQLNYECWS